MLFPYGHCPNSLTPLSHPPLSKGHQRALFSDPICIICFFYIAKMSQKVHKPSWQAFWPRQVLTPPPPPLPPTHVQNQWKQRISKRGFSIGVAAEKLVRLGVYLIIRDMRKFAETSSKLVLLYILVVHFWVVFVQWHWWGNLKQYQTLGHKILKTSITDPGRPSNTT